MPMAIFTYDQYGDLVCCRRRWGGNHTAPHQGTTEHRGQGGHVGVYVNGVHEFKGGRSYVCV